MSRAHSSVTRRCVHQRRSYHDDDARADDVQWGLLQYDGVGTSGVLKLFCIFSYVFAVYGELKLNIYYRRADGATV